MITLYWIFSNGHKWHKTFSDIETAEKHAEICGFFSNPYIDRAWIETETAEIWLKEKH